jgi:class 3 adenylate cyclase
MPTAEEECCAQPAGRDFPALPPSRDLEAAAGVLRAVVFTDVGDERELRQRLGVERMRELLSAYEENAKDSFRRLGGVEERSVGVAFRATFPSATHALQFAANLQRTMGAQARTETRVVRVGVSAIAQSSGTQSALEAAISLAERVAKEASGGQVLVSDVVRHLVAGEGFMFAEHRAPVFSGVHERIRVWELIW